MVDLRRALTIPLCLLSLAVPGWAGQAPSASHQPPKGIAIRKIQTKLQLDGKLEENVWSTIDPITDFVQTEPDLGAPVSERTEVRIFYDDENLYLGFKYFDSRADLIVHHLGAHDAFTRSDSAGFLIDPFHDRRTGYYFSISAGGTQFDAISNDGNGGNQDGDAFDRVHDETWDGIWHSAVSLERWGWSAEVVIPFKSIRIPRTEQQTWGLNLRRSIPHKDETAYWSAVARFDGTMRPSKSGTMTGLEHMHVGRNLELIPFGSFKYRRSGWAPQLAGASGTSGIDGRYGLAANLTANFAVNPDFGETEVDEFTAQLSRFEIFFPEKRKFFTEGANYFRTPLQLFFSRRIGSRLPDGEPQNILEGGKVTGKAGAWTLGALEVLTQRDSFINPTYGDHEVSPQSFFGVLRLQRGILQKSAIGIISVNRFQDGGVVYDPEGNIVSAREAAHGIDLSILHGEHTSWISQVMVNTNAVYPGLDGQHLGWTSQFNYESERFLYSTGGKFLGRNTELSQIGYEPETDRWSGFMTTEFRPFINRWGIRQLFLNLNYDESNGTRGELEDSGADVFFHVQFKNFWDAGASYSYDRVRFNEFGFCPSTAMCDARLTPELATTQLYLTPKFRPRFSTNENKPLSFNARFVTGKLVQFEDASGSVSNTA